MRPHLVVVTLPVERRLGVELDEVLEKDIARLFGECVDGFKGGLSAEIYIAITKASRATATRDLQDLVAMGPLSRAGELRHTRYHLSLISDTAM